VTTRTHRTPASESSAVQPVIEVRSVSKSYGHVQALRDASLEVFPSEVLALIGDKGAGKSTLTNVIRGVVHPNSGSLFFDGVETTLSGVRDAQAQGVGSHIQSLNLLIEQAAPERLLWGSDFSPCLDYVSFAQAADPPYLHRLSDEDRESVYGGNLRRVVAGVVR